MRTISLSGLHIKNDEFCIKNVDFLIKTEGFDANVQVDAHRGRGRYDDTGRGAAGHVDQ